MNRIATVKVTLPAGLGVPPSPGFIPVGTAFPAGRPHP